MKIILRVLLWLVIGLIIALLLVPVLFKGELVDILKKKINEQVNAQVDFDDVDLSLIKSFPAISLDIENMKVVGLEAFAGEKLFSVEHIHLTTDFKSVIKPQEGINVKKITVDRPKVNLVISKSGESNYDIIKSSGEESSSTDFFGSLDSYVINDGVFNYTDLKNNTAFSMKGLNHEGKGNFAGVAFDLKTKTKVDQLNLSSGSIPYLNNARLGADVVLGVDLEKQHYTFKENQIRLNDLDLSFLGTVKLIEDAIGFDLDIQAPNNKVSSIISLIPSTYKGNFESIKSTGNSFLKGSIKGIFDSAKEIYPKTNLLATIENGTLQYPELPLPINDINMKMEIAADKQDWSDMVVDIENFSFLVKEDKMAGKVKILNALENPSIDGLMKGTLNLKNLSEAFPLDNVDLKNGVIKADLVASAKASDITDKNYKAMSFNGSLETTDVDVQYDKWPVALRSSKSAFTPAQITTSVTDLQVGNSDFNGDLKIKDPLAYISEESSPSLNFNMKSKVLDADELMNFSGSETTEIIQEDSLTLVSYEDYKDYNISGTYSADEIKYEEYDLKKLKTSLSYGNDHLDLTSTEFLLNEEPTRIRGTADNLVDYIFDEGILKGKFFLNTAKINADDFMDDEATASTAEARPFQVSDKLDVEIYPEIKSLTYDKYLFENLGGKISIANGIAQMQEGSATSMGGKMIIDGLYNSTDLDNPLFDLRYKLDKIAFKKLFEVSESFRVLAPIAKYIDGALNSTLIMAGPLKQDMTPDLTKVTASGFLETLKGVVRGFEPLERVGKALGIEKLKDMTIDGSKNWFDVKNGVVLLKPHDHKVDDMTFTVAGNHSLDQTIDYTINAKIPRDKLRKDKLGKNLEFGMEYLEKEAGSRGVNIDLGEMIYLDIFLTGNIKSPKVKVIPVGSGGKTLKNVVKDEVNKQVDILKDTIQTELEKKTEEVKDTVTKVVTKEVDKAKEKAKEKVDEEVEKQKDKVRGVLKGKVDTALTKVLTDTLQNKVLDKTRDVLGDGAAEKVDDVKDKLKEWNPFKKKGGN